MEVMTRHTRMMEHSMLSCVMILTLVTQMMSGVIVPFLATMNTH